MNHLLTVAMLSVTVMLACLPGLPRVFGQDQEALAQTFAAQVHAMVQSHCLDCHDATTNEAQLDLSSVDSLEQVLEAPQVWQLIMERVAAGEMPPPDVEQPTAAERKAFVDWIQAFLDAEAARTAGDPGPVLARRLSNAEYDGSIRELTGVDIRPTRTFPVDPANAAGFDNSGESLAMSPGLLSKYLEAARTVADHMLLTPTGIVFAPHPVVTDTDRDKYCVKRIVDFYLQQPTDVADYLQAAWRYKHRTALELSEMTLAEVATAQGISAMYLQAMWDALHDSTVQYGPLAKVQQQWQALPPPPELTDPRAPCESMRDYLIAARRLFEPKFDNLELRGIHSGSQSFVLWKNEQYANHRRTADFRQLEQLQEKGEAPEIDADLVLPTDASQRESFERDCQRFCELIPDAFFISERGRDYLDTPKEKQEKGRLLSAGFHSMMGYFRDDQPLMQLILNTAGQTRLNALWDELNFAAAAPRRQYQGYLWFERAESGFIRDPEFDFARPEDQDALTQPVIERFAEIYLAKAARGGEKDKAAAEVPLQAIRDYFTNMNQQIRWVDATRATAEPLHIASMLQLAERAYRRPLTGLESDELTSYYRELRDVEGLNHEEAIQDMLVAVLVSPKFSYRLDLLSDSEQPRALNDYELASRLSFFLWSTIPDAELLQHAAEGDLHEPEVLKQQTRRMLADPRVRGLATEFGGNWLDFRRFEEHNSVDRQRFPSFDDELRTAMFEEPVRYFIDIAQQDRSILEFILGERTQVNRVLAAHYGMHELTIEGDEWVEVPNAQQYGRGGVLPMAVFMTKNAPGLRTSPVKRGYWVVKRLLGEHIPAPPPNVPELPADETQLGELTLRETLAKHREHASCAGCHNRIDSIGLVFEGFGPIGEQRQVDLGGRPVDAAATLPDGSQCNGLDDLRVYLQKQRSLDFVNNFNRKLLSYALGRSLQLSDQRLLNEMRDEGQSAAGSDELGYRFVPLVEKIVTSPQFLNKRARDH
jgi:mono/diheme cytochrome c family protein